MQTRAPFFSGLAALLFSVASASGQTPPTAQPHARLLTVIDDAATVTLHGNVHPLARAAALGASTAVDAGTPMEHMILHLKGDAAQETQLAQLLAQQNDPKSPLFHQYLTPQQFGSQFGVAESDIAKVTAWLQSHGFTINKIPAGNKAIVFSGTASQVASAFNTEIRSFTVAGQRHIANTVEPQIPVALADVVAGVVQLHDFQAGNHTTPLTRLSKAQLANPQYTDATGHSLAPPDFSIIYNTNPLYAAGIDGTGQSIAIVARSNIQISDIETFRTMFGLPQNDPQIILVSNDPGLTPGNATETTLDTEWAGAIAPKAKIKVVVGLCTNTADGVAEAELYAVNNNVAPIISISYGQCEATMGSSQMAFYNALWQQAAAQGQTVIAASGDMGAAGCNSQADPSATVAGINGLCSSPFSTCVGGTQFVEGNNPGQYWLPGNNSANGSALSYIPETVWNESGVNGGSGLTGGGGGPSIIFAKPSWQTGIGVPADGMRDVPDVSLSSARHDGYLVYQNWAGDGGLFSAGGTSFATPAFAALVALVNQKTGVKQGLINPTLYNLAANQAAGGAAVFHDITTGNNSVPGLTGFAATAGYDMATGLGSVDATQLVNHWTDGLPGITITAGAGKLSISDGQTTVLPFTVVTSPALNSAVTFSVSGAPTGMTATFAPPTLAAPGSGSTNLSLSVSLSTAPGTYSLAVVATGGGQLARLVIPITVGSPTFLLLTDKTSLSLGAGVSAKVAVTTTAQTGFSSALTLALTGAPAGVTAALSVKSVAAPGTGSSLLTVVNTSATPGNYWLTITGTGGGRTVTTVVPLCIPTFVVTSPASYYAANAGGSVTIPVTITPQSGFIAPISLSAPNYLPSGVGISFSPGTVSGTADGTSNLTLTVAKTVPNGAYPFMIYGTGGGVTQSNYVYLLVGITQSCTLWVYDSTMSGFTIPVTAGQSNTGSPVCLWPQGTFNGPLAVSFSSIPTGLSVQSLEPLVAGGTPSKIQVSAAQNMAAGTYNFKMIGSQGTFTTSYAVTVSVAANSFALTASQSAIAVPAGASATFSVTSAHKGVFNSPISFSWSGLPTGVTASLAKSVLAAPGDGTVATNFVVATTATPGTYTATLTATGNSQTQTIPVTLTIAPPTCTLGVIYPTAGTTSVSLFAGQTGSVSLSCSALKGAFNTPLILSVSGAPAGVTATAPTSMAVPGANAVLQVVTPLNLGAASFSLSVTAKSGSFTQIVPVSVTVTPSNFTVTPASTALTISQGTSAPLNINSAHQGLFSSAVTLAWSGLPTGVTASSAKAILAAPGDGTATTTFAVSATAAPGTYTPTLTATGGGLTQTIPFSLVVAPPPSCTAAMSYPASASSLVVTAGSSASASLICSSPQGVFSAPISLKLTGAPTGVTVKTSAASMAAGDTVTIQVQAAASLATTTFNLSLSMTSGTFTKTLPIAITVNANRFTMTASSSTASLTVGSTAQVTVSTAHVGVFNSALTLSWTLPAGVAASFVKSVPAPGDGTVVTTFIAAATAKPGTYTATLSASGGGLTQTYPVTLTISAK